MPKKRMPEPVAPLVNEGLMPGLLSVKQAAQYLNLAHCTVYQIMKDNRLRSVKWGTRRLIPTTELNRYIQQLLDDEYGDAA